MKDYVSDIKYIYNLNLNLYKADYKDKIVQVNPSTVFDSLSLGSTTSMPMTSMMGEVNSWTELTGNEELLKAQGSVMVFNRQQENRITDLARLSEAANTALETRVGTIPADTTIKSYIDTAVGSGGTASAQAIALAKQEAISESKSYTDTKVTAALTVIEF